MGSHNQQEAKSSSNPQIEKQLTTGIMGRMTHSSTLPIPCSWSYHMAPGSITHHSLGGKSFFQAHTGTQSSTLPLTTQPATFTLKCQGNQCLCVNRTHGSCFSSGNRTHKPAGSVPLEAVPLNCAPWSPVGNQAPRLPLPKGLVLLCLQCYCTTFPEPMPGKQASELLLPKDLVPLHLQQLLWPLEVHTPM
jgi:hypothetical protein